MQTKTSRTEHLHQLICGAILHQKQLRFLYEGRERVVTPAVYGSTQQGDRMLRAYQVSGASASGPLPGWRLFEFSQIHECRANGEKSPAPPGYVQSDGVIVNVYAQR